MTPDTTRPHHDRYLPHWSAVLVPLVVIGIVGIYYFSTELSPNTKDSLATPDEQTENVDGWKTYRNEEHRFEIHYPADWELMSDVDGAILTSPETLALIKELGEEAVHIPGDIGLAVTHSKTNQMNEEYYNNYVTQEKIRVANRLATRYDDREDTLPQQPAIAVQIESESESIWITLNQNSDKNIKIFNQILSTFRFFEPPDAPSWQTYRSEDYGFAFQYPSDWQITEQNNIPKLPSISATNVNASTFNVHPHGYPRDVIGEDIQEQLYQTEINGLKITRNDFEGEINVSFVTFENFPNFPELSIELWPNNSTDKTILEKILASFTLLEMFNTSDWQTYQNEEYNFEFQYPNNWTQEENQEEYVALIGQVTPKVPAAPGDIGGFCKITIHTFENPDQLSLAAWLAKERERTGNPPPDSSTPVIVGNINSTLEANIGGPANTVTAYIPRLGHIIAFNLVCDITYKPGSVIFDRVLSTVIFF